MPNWTFNTVSFDGPDARDIVDLMGEDFSFDNLCPMPEELNIDSGATTWPLIVYLTDGLSYVPDEQFIRRNNFEEVMFASIYTLGTSETIYDEILNSYEAIIIKEHEGDVDQERLDKLYSDGEKYFSNFENYKAFSWFEWRCNNWGCKWPASEVCFAPENVGTEKPVYSFDTPWDMPRRIYELLSLKFPETEIIVEAEFEGGPPEERYRYKCGKPFPY